MQDPTVSGIPAPQAPAATNRNAVIVRQGQDPVAAYRAADAQRDELRNQMERLEETRHSLSNEVKEEGPTGAVRMGIENRVIEVDKQISALDKQIASAEQQVAAAAAVPGAIVERPPEMRNGPPEEAYVMGGFFMLLVLCPIAIGYARRLWKRGTAVVSGVPQELLDRLGRLDQAVDSIAIEVERIGEGQRFVTRVMSEGGRALPAGAAARLGVASRGEKVGVTRKAEHTEL